MKRINNILTRVKNLLFVTKQSCRIVPSLKRTKSLELNVWELSKSFGSLSMFFRVVVLVLIAFIAAESGSDEPRTLVRRKRLVKGFSANIQDYPFMVRVAHVPLLTFHVISRTSNCRYRCKSFKELRAEGLYYIPNGC